METTQDMVTQDIVIQEQFVEPTIINKENELTVFKETMDSWVKFFNNRLNTLNNVSYVIEETHDNTNHNYELIKETRQDIEFLKEELKGMKMMQMLLLQKVIRSERSQLKGI